MNTIKNTVPFCRLLFSFIFISLFGWCFEVVGRYIVYGVIADRGFLHLPLCPIYGFCIIGIAALFGTPIHPRRLAASADCKNPLPRYAIYFIIVSVFASLIELLTALAFLPFGVRLWTYEEQPLNLFGFICLGYSVLWGALITLFMAVFWKKICRLVCKIPPEVLVPLSLSLGACVLADFVISCIIMII